MSGFSCHWCPHFGVWQQYLSIPPTKAIATAISGSFSLRRSAFVPRLIHLEILVKEVALEQVLPWYFCFPLPPILVPHLHIMSLLRRTDTMTSDTTLLTIKTIWASVHFSDPHTNSHQVNLPRPRKPKPKIPKIETNVLADCTCAEKTFLYTGLSKPSKRLASRNPIVKRPMS